MSDVLEHFDIAQDIKVEFLLPNSSDNIFILGISELGSDDVLSTGGQFVIGASLLGGDDLLLASGLLWQGYQCSVAEVQTSVGGEVQDALFFQPRAGELSVTLQNLLLDPTNNPAFRPGVPVRIRLERDEVDITLFRGFIDNMNVGYDVDNNHILQFTAYDSLKQFVNSRLAILDTTDEDEFPDGYATPYEVIELLADQFGTSMNAQSAETRGKLPPMLMTDFIPNTVLYDAIQTGLGIFWVDQETQEFVLIPRPALSDTEGSYSVGNNHTDPLHLCMSDIEVASDIDNIFNSLFVSLKDDSETSVLVNNVDSIELYGVFATDATVNTTDVNELEDWANSVFNSSTRNLIRQVQTPAINRLGNLTHAAVISPGETIRVVYQTSKLNINQAYTVTKVSHNINVDNWFTTLELWKEF